MSLDRVVLILARVALGLDRCTLALHLVRLDLGPVRIGRVPAAATATGPPPGNKVGARDAGAGGGARDPRGIRWSPVEKVKSGGARDRRGIRWSPVEQVKSGSARDPREIRWSLVEQGKVGRATRAHALAGTRLALPAPTCGCRTDGPVGTEMQAHARHPMDPGEGGGGKIPTPYSKAPARARIASGVPHRRSCDSLVWPGTVQAEKGATSHNAMPGRGTGRYGRQRGTDRRR